MPQYIRIEIKSKFGKHMRRHITKSGNISNSKRRKTQGEGSNIFEDPSNFCDWEFAEGKQLRNGVTIGLNLQVSDAEEIGVQHASFDCEGFSDRWTEVRAGLINK